MNRVRSGTEAALVEPFMCRKGAWAELTVEVTSVERVQRRLHGF